MKTKTRRRRREIVLRQGKPAAVILDIESYRDMLEQLEDVEDLKELEEMRRKPLAFKRIEDFLGEHSGGV